MEIRILPTCFVFLFAFVLPHASATGAESNPVFAIERINLTSSGNEFAESFSLGHPTISADGRYVVFTSNNALVPGDTNGRIDVYMRDRVADTTELVSLTSTGALATGGDSFNARISADGTCVAFVSNATNLVPEKTGFFRDVYIRNLISGTTTRASVATGNVQANADSGSASVTRNDLSISDDGRYVAFRSTATNLVSGDTNGLVDVFRHDRSTGTTVRASLATGGAEATGWECDYPAISGDGSKVAFSSREDFGGNQSNHVQIWLRDIEGAATELISKSNEDIAGNNTSSSPDLSFDGRYVVYDTFSSNLLTVPSSNQNVIVRDRQAGETILVSVTTTGDAAHGYSPAISANGRYISFASFSQQLFLGDTGTYDVFVRDLQTERTGVASRTSTALIPNANSLIPALADETLETVFMSYATNLVPGDTNLAEDIFVSTPVFPSRLLINEVDAVSGNARQFIELYDGGAGMTDLSGLTVVLYNGETDQVYDAFDLDGQSTDANGFFLIATAEVPGVDLIKPGGFLQGGVDAVALYYDNATSFPNGNGVTTERILDAVVHENGQTADSGLLPLLQNSSQPLADESENGRAATESVQRFPNGSGYPGVTGVYRSYSPTPGGPNGAPAALDLDVLSDSGRSDTDNITGDVTPTISGVAPAGSTVILSSNLAGAVGGDTADGTGAWSITPSAALPEGSHFFTATADGGSSGEGLSVVIDTTAPSAPSSPTLTSASDSGESNSDRITKVVTPTFEGTAVSGSVVTISSDLDGVVGTTESTGSWSILAAQMSDGLHGITATATDLAGNESIASTSIGITIDTVAPGVAIAKGSGQADPASGAPLAFTALFDETVSGLGAGEITASGSATPGDISLAGGPASYTITVGSVAGEGVVTVSIGAGAAEDNAGNLSGASTGSTNIVEIDQHGNTSGSATTVTLIGSTGSADGHLGVGDTDFFSFTLTESKLIIIETGHGVDTYGALRNAAGDLLNDPAADDNSGNGSNFRIGKALAPGTYYVEVTGTGTSPTGAYQISFDATASPVTRPDAVAGGTLSTAVGGNLYGPGQLAILTSRRAAPVSAVFAIGNDGDLGDVYLLGGGRGNTLFAVSYNNAVAGNITAAIQTGTYSTGTVEPGAPPYLVNLRIVPSKKKLIVKKRVKGRLVTTYLKKSFILPLTARSATDPLVNDAVTIQVKTQ